MMEPEMDRQEDRCFKNCRCIRETFKPQMRAHSGGAQCQYRLRDEADVDTDAMPVEGIQEVVKQGVPWLKGGLAGMKEVKFTMRVVIKIIQN